MFRKIVIDAQRVPLAVTEEFADRTTTVGRQILHRRGVARRRGNDDRVIHGAVFFEGFHNLRHSRSLLPDRNVDANDVLTLLIDDRVDRDGSLSGLAVTDDQFALAAAYRDHRIDGFQSGLKRLLHGLAIDNTGRDTLNGQTVFGDDGAFPVDGLCESIHDTAD